MVYIGSSIKITALELPLNLPYQDCTNCSKDHTPEGYQVWGLLTANLDLSDMRSCTGPYFSALSDKYDYILWQTGDFSSLFNASIPR
jgi:hypothetical protein